jgi:hypothetical protein
VRRLQSYLLTHQAFSRNSFLEIEGGTQGAIAGQCIVLSHLDVLKLIRVRGGVKGGTQD